MGDETPDVGTAAQAELRRRLRTGAPIWLYHHPGAYVAAILTGALAACFLFPLARLAFLWAIGHPEIIRRYYDLTTLPFWLPILVFVSGLTSFLAAVFWRVLLLARVRMTETDLEYPDWWGRTRVMGLPEIVAAGIFTRLLRRGGHRHELRACQVTPGTAGGSRWVCICGAFVGVRLHIAEVVLHELRQRCELAELSPASQVWGAEIWQRSGHEFDIPPQ
jgi:hypothetical protein